MDWREITAKTVDDALSTVMLELGTSIDNIEYEVIEKETSGFLGMFGKPAKIKARVKMTAQNLTKKFLDDVFHAMGITAKAEVVFDQENSTIEINIDGDEMGVLIGKRGQTLDSLQYLVSLVVNKNSENYIKVKLDTENYRARRKETLENLAKNIAFKVKRTRKPVSLEPMNPYERRIIHSALQNDKYVETYSEGEEPYRRVVINVKKGMNDNKKYSNNKPSGGYRKDFTNNNSNNHSSNYNNNNYHNTNRTNNSDSTVTTNNTSNTNNMNSSNHINTTGNHTNTTSSNHTNTTGNHTNNTSSNHIHNTSGATNKNYKKPFNTSKSGYNKNYSADYKKDYEKYKESKEKKTQDEETETKTN